jgi:GntR family transcriptional regulator
MIPADTLGFRPLYLQVRENLTKRIADGSWRSGEIVPSEMQIAAELGVSQGTVRKALDDMTVANLLVRKQGKGTFVASHDEARILFQFFKLQLESGEQVFPESDVLNVSTSVADQKETTKLALAAGESVIRIKRIRSLAGKRAIVEMIVLPAALFEGFQNSDIPNNLYNAFSQNFGITISGGSERLTAVLASETDLNDLGLSGERALLQIDRVATGLDGRPIEWRVSKCDTRYIHYVTELR